MDAVVLGCSTAGLLAARVLSKYCDQVTVVDRDRLPSGPVHRRFLPQAGHPHILLARGQRIMDELLPGFCADLLRVGAACLDFGRDFRWFNYGTWSLRFQSGLPLYSLSRPLFDYVLRKHVTNLSNIRVIEGWTATGLMISGDSSEVAGVSVSSGESPSGEHEVLADIVVDASGRGSKLPDWLVGLGYPPVEETSTQAAVSYATRIYRLADDFTRDWSALAVFSSPPGFQAGYVVPIEAGLCLATLADYGVNQLPTDDRGFVEFAHSLPVPHLFQELKRAVAIGDTRIYRFPGGLRRHYERMVEFPNGLIVMGDAFYSGNPTYAQGILGAAVGAEMLDRCLRESGTLTGLSRSFHRSVVAELASYWCLAALQDEIRSSPDKAGVIAQILSGYMRHFANRCGYDRNCGEAGLEIVNGLRRPSSLFGISDMLLPSLQGLCTLSRLG